MAIADVETADESRLNAPPESDYWSDAQKPLASLVFLIPWLAAYEFGIVMLNRTEPDSLRNGADFWLRSLLTNLGIGPLLLPLLVVGALLTWHVVNRDVWQLKLETLLGMFAESLLLAVVLIAAGQLHDVIFRWTNGCETPGLASLNIPVKLIRSVTCIGAGVYEEVMFRLILIPVAIIIFRMFEFPSRGAAVMAAISTSFLFALAHHIGPSADGFNLFTFSFRAAAGLFFASVFLLRGFGITVGCHAGYDLLVGVILSGR